MQQYHNKQTSEDSMFTEDSWMHAPIQRPLEASQDLPELFLGTTDYIQKPPPSHVSSRRRKSDNEAYSILGYLCRKTSGGRARLFSENLLEMQPRYKQFSSRNGGKQ